MPFFDILSDDELTPDARRLLDDYARLTGREHAPDFWRVLGRSTKIIEGRLKAAQTFGWPANWPKDAQNVAIMLIAHAKRCQTCFTASRLALNQLGFDETTLDSFCANPSALPLKERDRAFVRWALRVALESANLTQQDFRDMEKDGFTRLEIQEIIAFAAYWNMNITFSQALLAAQTDD